MFEPTSVQIRGPLAAYAEGLWAALLADGYAPLTARNHLHLAAQFSRWLESRRLSLGELSEAHVGAFLRSRRRRGYTGYRTRHGLQPLLAYLRRNGVEIRREAVERTALDELLAAYAEYLARNRQVGVATIKGYVKTAREFATGCLAPREADWRRLSAAMVTDFVMREVRRRGRGYVKHELSNLRSFLRFLHVQGHIEVGLAGCVPAIAGWRLASVPPALDADQIDRLLHVHEGGSPTALRNAAVIQLLLGLALRAGDVAALELDHVDWRAGELLVCGKGKHVSRLPLPYEVGRALAAYLRCRPRVNTRRVFLRSRAPFVALTSGGVVGIARTGLRAAGITAGGAHLLRHTAATRMLRKGASLAEIAHVLRHRHIDTTAIYAKVDLASLHSVARPWPEAVR